MGGTPEIGRSQYVFLVQAGIAPFGEPRADGIHVPQLEGQRIKAVIAKEDIVYSSDPRVPKDSPSNSKFTGFEILF